VPVKLDETSGDLICLWRLLGLDDRARLVDPDLGGQSWGLGAASVEAVAAGGEGVVEDLLSARLDGYRGAVVDRRGRV
jgi:hypothetical protein